MIVSGNDVKHGMKFLLTVDLAIPWPYIALNSASAEVRVYFRYS